MEIWKEIEGYEGYYEVSNFGNVKSLDRTIIRSDGISFSKQGKIMVQNDDIDGYPTVHLSKGGKDERISVHILVAKAFVPGYKKGLEVNHIDFDRHNNHVDNLEWVTHTENVEHSYKNGRHPCQINDYHGKNNPNYGNHKLHEKYLQNPELCKINQSRPGVQNGRATAVIMHLSNDEDKYFGTFSECAIYLMESKMVRAKRVESVATKISEAAKTNKKYRGFNFSIA